MGKDYTEYTYMVVFDTRYKIIQTAEQTLGNMDYSFILGMMIAKQRKISI